MYICIYMCKTNTLCRKCSVGKRKSEVNNKALRLLAGAGSSNTDNRKSGRMGGQSRQRI